MKNTLYMLALLLTACGNHGAVTESRLCSAPTPSGRVSMQYKIYESGFSIVRCWENDDAFVEATYQTGRDAEYFERHCLTGDWRLFKSGADAIARRAGTDTALSCSHLDW